MKQKPYLISCSSYTPGLNRYLKTLENLEDSVELVMVEFEPVIRDSYQIKGISQINRVKTGIRWPGMMHRLSYIPKDLDESRWWVFTDSSDVVFQGPIPLLPDEEFILTSKEGETFSENGFWIPYLKRYEDSFWVLNDFQVRCAGTWAMKGKYAKQYIEFIEAVRERYVNAPDFVDQMVFNQWLSGLWCVGPERADFELSGLFGTLYKNAYTGKIIRDVDGNFWEGGRIMPAIIHGNGCSKEFLDTFGVSS
jgi:hypothetical protein